MRAAAVVAHVEKLILEGALRRAGRLAAEREIAGERQEKGLVVAQPGGGAIVARPGGAITDPLVARLLSSDDRSPSASVPGRAGGGCGGRRRRSGRCASSMVFQQFNLWPHMTAPGEVFGKPRNPRIDRFLETYLDRGAATLL